MNFLGMCLAMIIGSMPEIEIQICDVRFTSLGEHAGKISNGLIVMRANKVYAQYVEAF